MATRSDTTTYRQDISTTLTLGKRLRARIASTLPIRLACCLLYRPSLYNTFRAFLFVFCSRVCSAYRLSRAVSWYAVASETYVKLRSFSLCRANYGIRSDLYYCMKLMVIGL